MEHLPIILLCGLLGLFLIGVAIKDNTPGRSILLFIGIWFIALPVCLINGWSKAFALLVTVPLGALWTAGAVSGLLEPFHYCIETEAQYKEYVFAGTSKRNHTRFYALKCSYQHGKRGYTERSHDHYTQSQIEKNFTVGSTIPIWVNKKNPKEFKVKRFHGMFAYSLLLMLGLGFLGVAVKIVFQW